MHLQQLGVLIKCKDPSHQLLCFQIVEACNILRLKYEITYSMIYTVVDYLYHDVVTYQLGTWSK